MKKAQIVSILAMFVLMAGLAGAAIGPTGGTEDFEGMTLLDDAGITVPDLPSNWDTFNITTDPVYYYDTSVGGGTLDTTGWSTAAGLTKPTGSTADIKMAPTTTAGDGWRYLRGPVITNAQDSLYTFWVGLSATPAEQDFAFGVYYNNSDFTFIRVNFILNTSPQSVSFRTKGIVVLDDATGNDNTNAATVNLNEWNKVEISVASSSTAQGSFSMKLNGVQYHSGTIPIDAAGVLSTHQFKVYAHHNSISGVAYLDDVTLALGGGTGEEDWRLY